MPRLSPLKEKSPRAHLLDELKREVQQRRAQSLHAAVLVNLSRETLPQQFERSWDVEVKSGRRPTVVLPQKASVTQVFDRMGGKLAILGAMGAGKTTTLLELFQVLIARAEKDESLPVPVVLELLTWKDEKQSIADWIVEQVKLKYQLSLPVVKALMAGREIVPLLDGLDELEEYRQERCIQAINQFLDSELSPKHLVVCSSFEAYKNRQTRFRLQAVILLRPLTNAQIKDYLIQARSRELWHSIERDFQLLKLARTPLFLSMMTLAFEDILIESWKRLVSSEEQRQYLMAAYIRRQIVQEIKQPFYPKGKEPKPEKIRHWLRWLAKRMQQASLLELDLEKLSANWLLTEQQQQHYRKIVQGVSSAIWGLIILGLIGSLMSGAVGALVVVLLLGALCGLFAKTPMIEQLVLRFILWRENYLPWNYRRFFNYASERLLLQKSGEKRYRFIHKFLQDYLAQL